jgi:hypothetical protein
MQRMVEFADRTGLEIVLVYYPVEGGSKRRRRERVGAVEIGGAHVCISAKGEDGGFGSQLVPFCREAQECDPIWSFGKRFVGWC